VLSLNRFPASFATETLLMGRQENYEASRRQVGYVPRSEAVPETYSGLGFKSGLEIHQQLLTDKKLFCHCPAGLYQHDKFDAEVIRHMRPTLSEMGEYDGTALMEKRTRKTIVYRIKKETACTYDFDDTPPFKINLNALDIALEVAMMLGCNLVGELHVARKQYLDGSIPTGFQRTAIIGIEGLIPLSRKKIRIIQLSIEEDSCREVSDIGHLRVYTTDRLGMPLIETVTYPDMLTPDEVAEAAHYLQLLVRTSGKVRTGLGAAREDVNVSITGGTRVEIKGVAHIRWIPELTHNEAFRQKALLQIRDILKRKVCDVANWRVGSQEIEPGRFKSLPSVISEYIKPTDHVIAVNLPGFKNLLSYFTQPEKCFANELSERLKVIACLNLPNMIHGESNVWFDDRDASDLRTALKATDDDAQLVFWGPADDMKTALEMIEERCKLAFDGVPNETRKSFANGTTIFERVLPGPDRMYPDTDSAPISIPAEHIEGIRSRMIGVLPGWMEKLRRWEVPADAHQYLVRKNLVPLVEKSAQATRWPEKYIALLFAHTLKGLERRRPRSDRFNPELLAALCRNVQALGCDRALVKEALPIMYDDPARLPETVVKDLIVDKRTLEEALGGVATLAKEFDQIRKSRHPEARQRWIVGALRPAVIGKAELSQLSAAVTEELNHG
jgi:glutamyl-tRNA(Gln) amidotransferase subunit E